MIDFPRLTIISGGQTGVDRAALDAAIAASLPQGGACPAGRLAEDGVIDARYRLTETISANPASRTRMNVRESDATLIISPAAPDGGTRLTVRHAAKLGRPCLVVDPADDSAAEAILAWLRAADIRVLNIAGPRESKSPGVYGQALRLLTAVFSRLDF